jgi:GTPase SAR1 family protein
MFIVIKTVYDSETAVGFIYEEENFSKFVEDLNVDIGAKYINGISADMLKSDEYQDGHYLIDSDASNEIVLINKYRTMSRGFFYTSTYINTDVVMRWKCIPFDGKEDGADDDASEVNLPTAAIVEKTFLDYELLDGAMIEEGSVIGVIGREGAGKSLVIESLLKTKPTSYLKNTLVVTTIAKENFYRIKLPDVTVVTSFDQRSIKEFLNRNTGAVIFDDVMIPKRIRGTTWDSIFFDNHNKTRIITSQKDAYFHPKMKRRMDYTFYLKDDNERTPQKIFNNYGQHLFDNCDEFARIFNHMTDNYGAIVFQRDIHNGNNYNVYRYNAVHKIKLD